MTKRNLSIGAAYFFLLITVSTDVLADSSVLASELDTECLAIELQKPSFLSRHWKWSGIFPLYGGFIDDPHITCFPKETLSQGKIPGGRAVPLLFQLAYLNPFWNDSTSAILLLGSQEPDLFAINIKTPLAREIHGFVEDGKSHIRVWELDGRIIVLLGATELRGVVELNLPLTDGTVNMASSGSKVFKAILTELANSSNAQYYRQELCSQIYQPFLTLAFVWFGGCSGLDYQARWNRDPVVMYQLHWGEAK